MSGDFCFTSQASMLIYGVFKNFFRVRVLHCFQDFFRFSDVKIFNIISLFVFARVVNVFGQNQSHFHVCRLFFCFKIFHIYKNFTNLLFLSTRIFLALIGLSANSKPIIIISSPFLIKWAAAPFMQITPEPFLPTMT